MKKYDFGGWATRNDMLCSDGRIIKKDAFKECDGITVPLVWNHNGASSPDNILGQALLHNMDEGVYCYGLFNDTTNGQIAKNLVLHGDINSLSIYANKLKQSGSNVLHGAIKEVSLVLAGANPGAYIDTVIAHSEDSDEEAIIYNDFEITKDALEHGSKEQEESNGEEAKDMAKKDESDMTIGEIFDTLTDLQKNAVYAIIGSISEENDKEDDEEDQVKHNCFDPSEMNSKNVLTHSEIEAIFKDAKRVGSLREAVLMHDDEVDIPDESSGDSDVGSEVQAAPYGIGNIDYLFPDDRNVTNTPIFIKRDTNWVSSVMSGVHHTPFSRIKSLFADLTEDQARAKGYIKGNMKKEQFFSLLKRATTPTTIYKKQKLDRDDVIDITDFDVVAWIKSEMRIMLDEEIARAVLVSDGRQPSDDDKIPEDHIRPIWTDDDLFTIKAQITPDQGDDEEDIAKKFIRTCIKARKNYKGSGNPDLYTTEDMVTNCLLIEDATGRTIYDSIEKLATKLRVRRIITVPVMENLTRDVTIHSEAKIATLQGIMVNLTDYTIGADKGGAVSLFDDFDIDFNAQKYLIETRCSGALTVPYSAIAIETISDAQNSNLIPVSRD